MLEYLHLKNWQSHKDTYIEFHPGVNIIVGQNNAGKTAIVRALWTLVFNPMGYMKKFKRFYTKKWPSIEVGWKGHTIVRNKEGYVLDGEEYKAVRDTVPVPIKQALNLTELNFKTIREDLFFVSMAQGARARLLNKVTGIDMQEFFVDHCTKKIAAVKDKIKTNEHLRTQYIREISTLTPVLELEDPISTIDATISSLVTTEETFNTVAAAYNSVLELEDAIEKKGEIGDLRNTYNEAKALYLERSELENRIGKLQRAILELQELEKISSRRTKVTTLRELVKKTEEAIERAFTLRDEVDEVETALNNATNLEEMLTDMKKKVEDLEKKKKRMLQDLGICPLCDTVIKKEE